MTRTSPPDPTFFLGVIPARGGSKGIPRKNLQLLAGLPLIAHTIRAALGATTLGGVVVSTEDAEIAQIARDHGAQTPFVRPAELAADNTPGMAVLIHAVKDHAQRFGAPPDYVVCLQPTSPFRTSSHIDQAIALALETGADSVVSVAPTSFNPAWLQEISPEDGRMTPFIKDLVMTPTRQEAKRAYMLNGAIYVIKTAPLLERGDWIGGDVRGFVMDAGISIDLDSPEDLDYARYLAEKIWKAG